MGVPKSACVESSAECRGSERRFATETLMSPYILFPRTRFAKRHTLSVNSIFLVLSFSFNDKKSFGRLVVPASCVCCLLFVMTVIKK